MLESDELIVDVNIAILAAPSPIITIFSSLILSRDSARLIADY